jgi:hypothetical protein
MGVPLSGSGYSAEPEPSCTVSAADAVSIPNAASAESLVKRISDTMATLPPAETLVSWSMAPRDAAWRILTERENFTVAHPDFWNRAEPIMRAEEAKAERNLFLPFRVLNADASRPLRQRVAAALAKSFPAAAGSTEGKSAVPKADAQQQVNFHASNGGGSKGQSR